MKQTQAYELFKKVVELDDGHIDAKRYLHLRRKQSQPKEEDDADTKVHFSPDCSVKVNLLSM